MEWIRSLDTFPDIPRWSMGIILGTGFVTYYLYGAVRQPLLACSDGAFRDFLHTHVPAVKEKFWPTVWCFESRLQTVFASVLRASTLPDIEYRREIVPLRDGGELALDFLETACEPDSPLTLVIPGLTGNSQAEYIKSLMRAAQQQGFRCVVLNNRGLGGMDLKTPRTYCAANYEDLMVVLDHLHKTHPGVLITCVGISMGGLQLGNYLACMGEKAKERLVAGMIISAPWDVFKASESIEQFGLNRLLNWHLASSLCRTLERVKHHMQGGPYDIEQALRSKTIREFDALFTCKQFGYTDVDDYYHAATLHTKLDQIKVPTLCLSAADDPFQPLHAIPIEAAHQSEHVAIVVTARGGHIGWLEGFIPLGEHQYMSRIFSQYVQAVCRQDELNF